MARAKYNAHTDNLLKTYKFFNYYDLVQLSHCIFMRQYSNKQLLKSFLNMLEYLPLSQQIIRDHDYNFKPKIVNYNFLKFFTIVQMLRAWNLSSVSICHHMKRSVLKSIVSSATVMSNHVNLYHLETYSSGRN